VDGVDDLGQGKVPVDDQRMLLELARRGVEAERRARERLGGLPLVQLALTPPDVDSQIARAPDPEHVRTYVRASPLTVTPQFADWAITRAGGAKACFEAAERLLPSPSGATIEPAARGAIAQKSVRRHRLVTQPWSTVTVADSGGW